MEKLHEYQGITGRLHQWRDNIKEKYSSINQENSTNIFEKAKNTALDQLKGNASANADYSHIYRYEIFQILSTLRMYNLETVHFISSSKYNNIFTFINIW